MTRPVAYICASANTMADLAVAVRPRGVRELEGFGYEVRFSRHAEARYFHTAGTAAQRAEDFMAGVLDPDVAVIMPVFGGYNSNQLLARLDYDAVAAAGKVLVGYSDTTALLLATSTVAGSPAVHGPSFSVLCDPGLFDYSRQGLRAVLAGMAVTFRSPSHTASDRWFLKPGFGPRELHPFSGFRVLREGEACAPIIGGNLETLGALAGTRFFPEIRGRILFVEDASGINPGAFHRDLTRLALMGVFEHLAGLVIGAFPQGTPLADPTQLRAILDDVLPEHCPYPVLGDVTCSHIDPMVSIPLGRHAVLSAGDDPHLTVNLDADGRVPDDAVTVGP